MSKEMEFLKLFSPEINEESSQKEFNEAIAKAGIEMEKIVKSLQLSKEDDVEKFFKNSLFQLRTKANQYREDIMDASFFDIMYGEGTVKENYNYNELLTEVNRKILFYEFIYSQVSQASEE